MEGQTSKNKQKNDQSRCRSTNADILNHCGQPAEHVRGCWAVDLVLGKG
jgi:hypothetical protein